MPETLRVLTLNCWGLKYVSKLRRERLRAIAHELAESEYDVVALQELWVESEDWQYMRAACNRALKYGKFFFTGAFGSGLAVLSRWPITATYTHMYTLTGAPVNVHQGDWIAGKACGCATVQHPSLGALDVWDTHVCDARTERKYSQQFTALGGQVGGEERRAFRITEAYELAELCRASAERGRHVLCMGDLNSLPESLSMGMLRRVAGLQDTAAVGAADAQITCDSPRNTWTHGKPLDENALRNAGKRLDYVLYRGPASSASRLQCAAHRVVFDGKIPGHDVSFTDHFGVEAEFSLQPQDATATPPAPRASAVVSVLDQTLGVLREALVAARSQQQRHLSMFVAALGGVVVLVAGNACASAWLWHARSVAPSVLLALLLIPMSWFGTTALYSAVIWGEWHKRALRMFLDRIETHRDALERELA